MTIEGQIQTVAFLVESDSETEDFVHAYRGALDAVRAAMTADTIRPMEAAVYGFRLKHLLLARSIWLRAQLEGVPLPASARLN